MPPSRRTRARRAGSAPRAASPGDAGAPRRRRARGPRAARSGPRARRSRRRCSSVSSGYGSIQTDSTSGWSPTAAGSVDGPKSTRQHPLAPPRERVHAGVRRDRVEPRAQRATTAEPRQPAPGPQERVLERVLRVVQRAQHPVAVGVELGRGARRRCGGTRPRCRREQRRAAPAQRRRRWRSRSSSRG